MKKIVRLTESDLTRIVKRVISERFNESEGDYEQYLDTLDNIMRTAERADDCTELEDLLNDAQILNMEIDNDMEFQGDDYDNLALRCYDLIQFIEERMMDQDC
jgi:hypothetical protein